MMDELPKISILVITYNQSKIIGRALDSILRQKEYVYEIIIGDDCSKDDNWAVINSYVQKYPDLIKPIRNVHNLGIFGNMENLYAKPTGDIVFWLSGDDEFCDGLFAETIEAIKTNAIDYKNELFAIYFDYRIEYIDKRPNRNCSNSMIAKNYDPVRLKLRGLISNRTSCYSVKLLSKFTSVRKDIGIFADALIDIQQMLYAEKNYYCRFIGSIYYAGMGVSSSVNNCDRYDSFLLLIDEIQTKYSLCRKDHLRWNYNKYKTLFYRNPSLKDFLKTINYYFISTDFAFGIKGLNIDDLVKFLVRACIVAFTYPFKHHRNYFKY